jgi:uncharacterized protein (DUF1330 family)
MLSSRPGARAAYLVIQGRLRAGGEPLYAQYLDRVRPLMREYGVEIAAVGEGFSSAHTTGSWPINALLRFPSAEAADAFLGDPRYLEIKRQFRDEAYDVLHLSLFLGRAPRTQ